MDCAKTRKELCNREHSRLLHLLDGLPFADAESGPLTRELKETYGRYFRLLAELDEAIAAYCVTAERIKIKTK